MRKNISNDSSHFRLDIYLVQRYESKLQQYVLSNSKQTRRVLTEPNAIFICLYSYCRRRANVPTGEQIKNKPVVVRVFEFELSRRERRKSTITFRTTTNQHTSLAHSKTATACERMNFWVLCTKLNIKLMTSIHISICGLVNENRTFF